jgi:hypothetical protein
MSLTGKRKWKLFLDALSAPSLYTRDVFWDNRFERISTGFIYRNGSHRELSTVPAALCHFNGIHELATCRADVQTFALPNGDCDPAASQNSAKRLYTLIGGALEGGP